jgi:ubiquinone/menaquinone biosynthesis C-methylase UbiE
VGRVNEADKAKCAEVAIRWDRDYWDGERRYGYGGYHYDGRWRPVAKKMVDYYALKPEATILDVGCGKGFLLYEIKQALPDAGVAGIDISQYAIDHAKEDIKAHLSVGSATSLPFPDKAFDFVVSINTLHNLYVYDLWKALQEIERVARGPRHITIEAYRNEREKANLLYWQLTCRAFFTPAEWEWIFSRSGYQGDYSYITFE